MKNLVKWMALFSILTIAGKAFMDAFVPGYEEWREKYPPEPEPEDDEENADAAEVVPASDLFGKGGALPFSPDELKKGGE